ncbi:hypothetical protein JXA88_02100 [Candidatus Fermentibacteria bacterium]|nr:hypothetical protein [Candidatus Fermentibacteria bacterium]
MEQRTTIQVSEPLRRALRQLAARSDSSYEGLLWAMVELFRELEPGRTLVSIPSDLARRMSDLSAGTDCRTLSEYVTFLLRLVLYESPGGSPPASEVSERMREKLQRLGYL